MKAAVASLALAAALLTSCTTTPGAPPRVIAFGDSLTDAGTYAARVNGRTPGKFTTNPGPLWIELVAQGLGTSIGPNRHAGWGQRPVALGGLDYAEGSARITQRRVPAKAPDAWIAGQARNDSDSRNDSESAGQSALPVRDQVSAFLAGHGRFEPRDIVFFWAGANDIFVHTFGAPQSPERGEALMREAARDLAGEVRRVLAAGAGRVVLLTIEDYGDAPATLGSPKRPMMSAWTRAFHAELTGSVTGLRQVTLVDVGGLLREVRRSPERFGLANVVDAACNLKALPDQDVLFCDAKTLVAPDAAQTYLYADDVHPTTAGQRIVAEHVLQALRRP